MQLLEAWGMLPSWFYVVWLSIQTVPLYKTVSRETVRPIGMRNPLSKLLNGLMIGENKRELVEYFEPQQIAMSEAGSAKLIHCMRLLAEMELLKLNGEQGEEQEELVGVKIDVKNAFNSCSGKAVMEKSWQSWRRRRV